MAKLKINLKSKKVVLVLILVIIVTIVAIGMFFIFGQKKGDDVPVEEPGKIRYISGPDKIDSMASVVGDRIIKEINEIDVDGQIVTEYVYEDITDGKADAIQYANYLLDEKEFVAKYEFDKNSPKGYICLQSESNVKSEVEGENIILQLEIDYNPTGYTIAVSQTKGNLPPKKEEEIISFTRDNALEYLREYTPETLQIDEDLEKYNVIFDVGISIINGDECYGVSIYEDGVSEQSNEIVAKYFVPLDKHCVYKYEAIEERYIEIENKIA